MTSHIGEHTGVEEALQLQHQYCQHELHQHKRLEAAVFDLPRQHASITHVRQQVKRQTYPSFQSSKGKLRLTMSFSFITTNTVVFFSILSVL